MSRRLLVVLVALGLLAAGGGVAGGLLLARDPGPPLAAEIAGPTTLPETTTPETSEPASSSSSSTTSSSSSSTSTSSGLTLQARVVRRLEDGVVVGYDASQPVMAVLTWGFGDPGEHQLLFPGPAAEGTLKLSLDTTRAVAIRVTGQSADGRSRTSGTLTARRLVRRVALEVQALTLDIPSGTGGISTRFRGTLFTPLGPGLDGPTASSEPYAFPSTALAVGERSSPLSLRFFAQPPAEPERTRVVRLDIPFPESGGTTLTREATSIGVTAHLRLRVTVTAS